MSDSRSPSLAARTERGLALVLTLLVLTLLVTAVLEFDRSTRTTLKAAGNFRDGMKAYYLATSGIAAAQAVLKDDQIRYGSVDSLTELWATPFPPYPLGDGTVAVAIQDEGGKLHLNGLHAPSGAKVPLRIAQLKELFRLKGLDPAPVDALVDWLDRDDVAELGGAESDYYQALEQPYRARNGPLDTLAELHLVKGFSDDVYRAVSSYLTVYKNAGDRVNLNTADPLILQTLPVQDRGEIRFPLSAEQVEKLAAARPFPSLSEINKVAGIDSVVASQIQPLLAITSTHFSVYAEGTANGVRKGVQAVVDRTGGSSALRYWRLAD
jgi:general secretion pathway protein K